MGGGEVLGGLLLGALLDVGVGGLGLRKYHVGRAEEGSVLGSLVQDKEGREGF